MIDQTQNTSKTQPLPYHLQPITKQIAAQEIYRREKVTLYACGAGFVGMLFTFGLATQDLGIISVAVFSVPLLIITVKAIKDMNRLNHEYSLGYKQIELNEKARPSVMVDKR